MMSLECMQKDDSDDDDDDGEFTKDFVVKEDQAQRTTRRST